MEAAPFFAKQIVYSLSQQTILTNLRGSLLIVKIWQSWNSQPQQFQL